MNINSYPKVYNLGHRAIAEILDGPVLVEEKVDGSQFSFGIVDGELQCRSRKQQIILDAPPNLFAEGVAAVQNVQHLLTPGWVYRAEYLQKPKHNAIAYGRIPNNHIVIFDVCDGIESYLHPIKKTSEAHKLGFEVVPTFFEGKVETMEQLIELLQTTSFLGEKKIEGVVLKRYDRFTIDGKAMMGKFVSEEFKERNSKEWKKNNPGMADVVQLLIAELKTEARWQKAVQHLRDEGVLVDEPKDIGGLMKAVGRDVLEEEVDFIKERLFKYAWPKIQRGVTAGLPQWYKEELAKAAFVG